jgi:hypothetical protein
MHKKVSRKRTMRKARGGYYGMNGAIAPGAANWTRGSEMGDWAVSNRGANAQYGSGKKRKGGSGHMVGGRKRSTKTRGKNVATRRRTQRGGNKYGGVSASFLGSGSRGLANHTAVSTRTGDSGPALGAFNNFGAQPGSGFGSFIKAH